MTTELIAHTTVTKAPFGTTPDGTPVDIYTLKSDAVEARIVTYGARIDSIKTADRDGNVADVVLGHDDLAGYIADKNTYCGAIVGRFGNRIAKGRFTLDGVEYTLPINNGVNALHGGLVGFDSIVWAAEEIPDGVALTLVSKDGDQGYPGTLTVQARYTLQHGSLRIDYTATTDKATVTNLTNHVYFNLSGEETILGHEILLNAEKFVPLDPTQIPLGDLALVEGTPLDFRTFTAIGRRISEPMEQLTLGGGYDHTWIIEGAAGAENLAATVRDPKTGRELSVTTTEPGMQFYTGNSIPPGLQGKNGAVYGRNSGFCLESQHYPDSPNQPQFPTTVLRPGETLQSATTFTFSIFR